MCRLMAVSSDDYLSPVSVLKGLDVMKEGYDGSGVGLLLRDLGGPFSEFKNSPILSGIFSTEGLKRLDQYMLGQGFSTRYKITFKVPKKRPNGIPKRDVYLIRAYHYPPEWEELDLMNIEDRLMRIRLRIKGMASNNRDMIVFSFWPDTVFIKETGDPMEVADYLDLDRSELAARVIMAQGRQNTNYEIDLYACHPFFLQGFSTMTNGENTAFVTNRQFLCSRGFPGYNGHRSDSEIFTHILHYTIKELGMPIEAFKHVITPLDDTLMGTHPNGIFLKHLKYSCRSMIIDGPNCVVGCLPDNSLFMVHDKKKLRPGVVGGYPGLFGFASEICGLDAVIPERDKSLDFQPMSLDTVVISPERKFFSICSQKDELTLEKFGGF
jgi:glutamate synthase domain-containing protein 1